MTLDEMKKRKKELGYSNARISELSGIPLGTVQKIFSGETLSPRYDTIQAIMKILDEYPSASYGLHIFNGDISYDEACEVCEPEPAFEPSLIGNSTLRGRNGQSVAASRSEQTGKNVSGSFLGLGYGDKTIEDYIALPEGTRVELIDGRFYDMAAPTTIHQSIGAEIFRLLKNHIEKNGGRCIPFIAPTDVQIDRDDKSMLQPDVLVVCDRSKITRARIVGAPDLVVEVVSPSNAITDVLLKMVKYRHAGVREYWIVYPDEKMVMTYNFEKGEEPGTYTFADSVPIAIWDGRYEIDFSYIFSQIDFMYDLK